MAFKTFDVISRILELNGRSINKKDVRFKKVCKSIDNVIKATDSEGCRARLGDDGEVIVEVLCSKPPVFIEDASFEIALGYCDGFEIKQDGYGRSVSLFFTLNNGVAQ